MAVLVTGGAGYIGSQVCVDLLALNKDVVIVDDLSNSSLEAVENIELISGKKVHFFQVDLKNKIELDLVFRTFRFSEVIHLAGVKSVNDSIQNPLEYYSQNILGTIILLDCMKNNHVKKIIFSSSATVYGVPEIIPIPEIAKTDPINPYGLTKLAIEQLLNALANADKDLSIVILRYFNPIGGHESGLIGEKPVSKPNNLMPFITQVAIKEREYLNVFGDDYDTKDGTGVRDYIHIADLSSGHIKALTYLDDFKGCETFNLGSGTGFSVLEIINAFQRVNGIKLNYKVVAKRKGDVAICIADIGKAELLLNWRPNKTIDDMCQDAWKIQQMQTVALTEAEEILLEKRKHKLWIPQ